MSDQLRHALEAIVALDLKQHADGRDDFYSGPGRFFEAHRIAREALATPDPAVGTPPSADDQTERWVRLADYESMRLALTRERNEAQESSHAASTAFDRQYEELGHTRLRADTAEAELTRLRAELAMANQSREQLSQGLSVRDHQLKAADANYTALLIDLRAIVERYEAKRHLHERLAEAAIREDSRPAFPKRPSHNG